MKNLILILAVLSIFTNCKKKEVKPEEPIKEQTYCVYEVMKGTRYFYKCTEGKIAATTAYNELNSQGKDVEVIAKNTCSECQ